MGEGSQKSDKKVPRIIWMAPKDIFMIKDSKFMKTLSCSSESLKWAVARISSVAAKTFSIEIRATKMNSVRRRIGKEPSYVWNK